MRASYERQVAEQIEIQRNVLRGSARICSPNFGRAWKGIFPHKAAEELAARTGCSVRTAGYRLSGEIEPDCHAVMALLDLIVPKRG